MGHEAGMIIWVQLLGDHLPRISDGKKPPKFSKIVDNIRLRSGIYPNQDINKQKTVLSTTIPATFGKKNQWTLVH